MFAYYLQNRVVCVFTCLASFLLLLLTVLQFSCETASISMETLGGCSTHCDHSVCTTVQGTVTGPGMGMWIRPGHWSLVLRLCWALFGRRLQLVRMTISLDLPSTYHMGEAHLKNGAANRERDGAEKWTEAPQSTDSGIPEPLLCLHESLNISPPPLFVFLPWVRLDWVFCHLHLEKNLDECAEDYNFSHQFI